MNHPLSISRNGGKKFVTYTEINKVKAYSKRNPITYITTARSQVTVEVLDLYLILS